MKTELFFFCKIDVLSFWIENWMEGVKWWKFNWFWTSSSCSVSDWSKMESVCLCVYFGACRRGSVSPFPFDPLTVDLSLFRVSKLERRQALWFPFSLSHLCARRGAPAVSQFQKRFSELMAVVRACEEKNRNIKTRVKSGGKVEEERKTRERGELGVVTLWQSAPASVLIGSPW